jgi:hypothetical protein
MARIFTLVLGRLAHVNGWRECWRLGSGAGARPPCHRKLDQIRQSA